MSFQKEKDSLLGAKATQKQTTWLSLARCSWHTNLTMNFFGYTRLPAQPDTIAPDGSEVRLLGKLPRGSLAHFTLAPGLVSKAISHRTVEEIWYVIAGTGQMWAQQGDQTQIVSLSQGTSLTIPRGTHFQFRCDSSSEPLIAVGATMPPWPGDNEATVVAGIWQPRL